jgi:hypothetical protein
VRRERLASSSFRYSPPTSQRLQAVGRSELLFSTSDTHSTYKRSRSRRTRDFDFPILQASARVEALRAAPRDAWIALSDDETKVVATGNSYQEVAGELDRMGDNSSVVLKTPTCWRPFSI